MHCASLLFKGFLKNKLIESALISRTTTKLYFWFLPVSLLALQLPHPFVIDARQDMDDCGLQRFLSIYGLKLSFIPENGKGRAVLATRDFCPGDIIISQEPYACAPSTSCCDGCFTSSSLKRCSHCQIAWYCGTTCQKSEWKLHQLECQALKRLPADRKKMLTSTLRVMVRLLLKKKLQMEKTIPSTADDNYDLVEALISHMSDIEEKHLVLYAQMANVVKLVLPSMEMDIKEVVENFAKLACNAHTICDSELRPLGTGIYTLISIVNHSCIPNSVLVFEGRKAVVRAVEHISRGSEVVITYIETATTTMERKKILKEQYLFDCKCYRCTTVDQDMNLHEGILCEGYRCNKRECNGILMHDSEKNVSRCHCCTSTQELRNIENINSEIKQLSEKASRCLCTGNCLESKILYQTLEQLQSQLHHPLSIQLLKTREDIMKILMQLKDWKGALSYCRLTIPVYECVYPTIHPMRGLQYYTCGKLEWLLGYTNEAVQSFTKALDVLRITHGTSTPFMRDLVYKLEEAHTEAACSRQPCE